MATGLEKELAALLQGAEECKDGAKKTGKEAVKTRRRSRDLEERLASMNYGEGGKALTALKSMTASFNINVDDDKALETMFSKIDEDKSGTIEYGELKYALEEHHAGIKDEQLRMLWEKVVSTDSDQKKENINLEDFKILVREASSKA